MLVGISFGFWIMQACITYAMRFIPGSLAGVLIYTAVPMAYILDIAFLGTHVGWLELLGVVLIVVSCMVIGITDYCGCWGKQ